jgi:hypothetical protein
MEENGLRSAYEIAMSRYGADEGDAASLDEEAKAAIRETKAECEAKIAERKIMMEAECRRLATEGSGDAVVKIERLREEFRQFSGALTKERDERVEQIRSVRRQGEGSRDRV